MKRMTAGALFTLACIFSVRGAFAQVRHEIHVTIPFDFTVANKPLPAGTYSIVRALDDTIHIQNVQTFAVAITLGAPNDGPSTGCVLDFEKHAGQSFMHAVLCDSAMIMVDFPVAKLERKARMEEAKLHETGSHLLIAAR